MTIYRNLYIRSFLDESRIGFFPFRVFSFLLLYLGGIFTINGQIPARYLVEPLGNNKSLNSSDVSALFQDKDGFIWVGTKAGVSRFDGYDFQNYSVAGGSYLGQIHDIEADGEGSVWVAGTNGLFFFKDEQFWPVKLAPQHIRAIQFGRKNKMWVGGFGFIPYSLNEDQLKGLKVGDSIQTQPIVSPSEWMGKVQSKQVWALDIGESGEVWIGLANKIALFDGKNIELLRDNKSGNHDYLALAGIKRDSFYWGSEDTGAHFQKGQEIKKVTAPSTYNFVRTDSILYMLTAIELVAQRSGSKDLDTLHTFTTYSNLYFKEMILDREGNFWIGAEGNLIKLTPSQIQTWSETKDSLLHANYAIAQLKDGDIIIGSSKQDLVKFENYSFVPYLNFDVHRSSYTTAIYPDEKGWNWYATTMAGLFRQQGSILENYSLEEGLGDKGQYLLFKDSQGRFWSGGENGISQILYDENGNPTFKNYMIGQNKEDIPIFTALMEGPDSTIWAISDKGLFKLETDALTPFAFPESVTPYPILTGVQSDSNGEFWLSTQGEGLWQCGFDQAGQPILIKQWLAVDGLLSNVVLNVHLDSLNRVWAVSQQGICCIDLSAEKETNVQCFDQSDGWPDASSAHYQLLEDKLGMLWAAGITDIARFPLYQLKRNEIKPQTFITEVQLFDGKENISQYSQNPDDSLSLPVNLKLPFNKNFLRFYFTTTSHTANAKNTFRYKMEGLDPQWYEGVSNRNVIYSGMRPGTYTFLVQAINNDGILAQDIASFSFVIKPAWYNSWWAIGIFSLIIASIVYLGFWFRLKRKIDQQEVLRLQELDSFKTQFYTNITHEFRTPLTVIQGMADELSDQPNEQDRKKLNLIKKNSQSLLALVNQILALSKLRAGKVTLNESREDVISQLKYLVESQEAYAKLKNVDLQFYSQEKSILMEFDVKKLERIIINLLSNAIKFTPEKGTINLVAKRIQQKGKSILEIQVKDNGIGIAEEHLYLIFNRYHQANPLHNNQGTGIGLAMVKHLVNVMKGEIKVESKLGEGTSFFLYLPIKNVNPSLNQGELVDTIVKKRSREIISKTTTLNAEDLPVLLIIEDNEDVRYYLKTCLEGQYHILTSTNGKKGLETAYETLPDIIISDVMMPEMDGFELCEILKKDERTNHIPIILLTAKASEEDKLIGLKYGADAYLTKPFSKEELLTRLSKLLEIRAKLQAKYLGEGQGNGKKPSRKHEFVLKAEALVLEHLENEDFSINELAQKLHLSTSQLYRKIKALTGLSSAIFIRHVRLQKAKSFLETEDLNISEVAYRTGFRSPVYFSQAFKEAYGKSPSEYQKGKI